jgi:hypothetical protein
VPATRRDRDRAGEKGRVVVTFFDLETGETSHQIAIDEGANGDDQHPAVGGVVELEIEGEATIDTGLFGVNQVGQGALGVGP